MALTSLALMMAALAASPADFVPPPGLYRVETDGIIKGRDQVSTAMRQSTEANGDTVARTFMPNGQVGVTVSEQGNGARTQCIKPVSERQALAALAAIAGGGACVASAPGVVENGSLVTRQTCPFGEFTHTVTRLDKLTWEFRVDAMLRPVASGAGMLANAAMMKKMLESAKSGAATPGERAQAAAALAELERNRGELAQQAAQLDAMQPEIARMQAEARQQGMPVGAGGMASQGVMRLTRIADSCGATRR
jgi:hypothetical protein